MIFYHILNLQIFYTDKLVFLNQFNRFFVKIVFTNIGYFLMYSSNNYPLFIAIVTSFYLS